MRHPRRFRNRPDGGRLAYVEAGCGSPVLMIHGPLTNLDDMLAGPFEGLAAEHRVIAVDRPGHGESTRLRLADASPWRDLRQGGSVQGVVDHEIRTAAEDPHRRAAASVSGEAAPERRDGSRRGQLGDPLRKVAVYAVRLSPAAISRNAAELAPKGLSRDVGTLSPETTVPGGCEEAA